MLHGHARVSPNLAVRLEEAGVGTARAWRAMRSAHDLAAERAADVTQGAAPRPGRLNPGPALPITRAGSPETQLNRVPVN